MKNFPRQYFISDEMTKKIMNIYMKNSCLKSSTLAGIGMYYKFVNDNIKQDSKFLHKRYSIMKKV